MTLAIISALLLGFFLGITLAGLCAAARAESEARGTAAKERTPMIIHCPRCGTPQEDPGPSDSPEVRCARCAFSYPPADGQMWNLLLMQRMGQISRTTHQFIDVHQLDAVRFKAALLHGLTEIGWGDTTVVTIEGDGVGKKARQCQQQRN